jgi:predicted nuclease with TOPRIM domain
MMISKMQEQSDQMKAQLDFMIKENEQLRKWVELELEQKYNVPGQGLKQING